MKAPRRKPILRTALTLVAALTTILSAFVGFHSNTGPLNHRATHVIVNIRNGLIDTDAGGLHGQTTRFGGFRRVRLDLIDQAGFKLPSLWFQYVRPNGSLRIQIPLFIPLTVLLAWTARGWLRFHRRRSRHHCHACGYPRLGLHSPTCPECGRAAPDPKTTPPP